MAMYLEKETEASREQVDAASLKMSQKEVDTMLSGSKSGVDTVVELRERTGCWC
jgi:hypothetical protein